MMPEPLLTKPGRRRTVADYVAARVAVTFRNDTAIWRAGSWGIGAAMSGLLILTALGVPTGLGFIVDVAAAIALGVAGLLLGAVLIAVVLSLASIPAPRLFAGCWLIAGAETYAILYFADMDVWLSAVMAGLYVSVGAIAGMIIGFLLRRRLHPLTRTAVLAGAAAFFTAILYWRFDGSAGDSAMRDGAADIAVPLLNAADPGLPGDYAYTAFTYGSGTDKRRKEFAQDARLVTKPVNASGYITRWSKLRTRYWGFDQRALPLNGRVWMPEGDGPHPIALIVHGNHLMEDWSDNGYAYLGELLASRGIIAVSVDQNFLNYSVWSGIPDQDMKMRAWVLLKHLQQIMTFNLQSGNPFSAKVDFGKVALVGHSRGGQAAAMAADRDRWFGGDQTLTGLDQVRIEAVVAIAPTDRTVDKQSAFLRDVYYLTLQGARDADVTNFYGDQQYTRSSFSAGTGRFKASVYIPDANHSRFNTTWGTYDLSMPGGILLNVRELMDREMQLDLAKTYISAFLELALNRRDEYTGLFEDERTARNWFRAPGLITRYESGRIKVISRFEQPSVRVLNTGVTAGSSGMERWAHEDALNRDSRRKGTDGLTLQWDGTGAAAYRISFDRRYWNAAGGADVSELAFSLANLGWDLRADPDADTPAIAPPSIDIELEGEDGATVRLPLSRFEAVRPLPHIAFTVHPLLERQFEEGKFKNAVEPVFQTFIVPLDAFVQVNDTLLDGGLRSVIFRMKGGPGKIMLDDIGFYPAS
ncbi:hypothetical protein BG53_12435 [Paenibacillus darwinianus]|uniref:Alpha/beta hydrolase n=1 Tax=Paenibacillus darwinianus TaxID=1380763 RepID=A0A9W5S321_9BACL|nr:hypothetical protein [Paenibacillus darwinianus]EXX90372.1 hypothetical protein BG52_13590 [Paenibacillus darwinianus]EXX91020.1 hypothetical protein BG53_12435 [Paenibacillus darwinianus]EXX91042.1 hypothetical protein CH50_14275 [Paenibacillus darwinianus]